MSKTTRRTTKTKKTSRAKRTAAKRPAVKKTAAKKTGAKQPAPSISLAEAPAKVRQTIARDLRRVLAASGIDGDLVQLQVSLPKTRRPNVSAPRAANNLAIATEATAAPMLAPPPPAGPGNVAFIGGPCPPNTVRRVVCEFRNGRFMCAERCVPV
jgi:hypothetical protein